MQKETKNNKISKILHKNLITTKEINIILVIGDGNCFYRSISVYFSNSETFHSEVRNLIYETAKENKETIRPFFIEGAEDEILIDSKLDGYIENIKRNYFYEGIIEISFTNDSNNTQIDIYTHLLTTDKNNDQNPCEDYLYKPILLIYDNQIQHFSLALYDESPKKLSEQINTKKDKNINIQKDFNNIIKSHIKKSKEKISTEIINEYPDELCTMKYPMKNSDVNYYTDIYNYLISKEKAINKKTKKIDWNKVIYPGYTNKIFLIKRENFRNRADNYLIKDNNLYKKDKNYSENNIKFNLKK